MSKYINTIKKCKHCGVEFKKNLLSTYDFCTIKCREAKRKIVTAINRERRKKSKDIDTEENRQWHIHSIYHRYRRSALNRKLEFTITKEQFATFYNTNCFYCGDFIKTIALDRLKNKEGYTIDNVVSCCLDCNFMKHSKDAVFFVEKCKKIAKNQSESKVVFVVRN